MTGFRGPTLALLCVIGLSAIHASSATAQGPAIESQSVTGVTSSNATLNAQINPNGLLTKYKLQIDATGNFDFFKPNSCDLHVAEYECQEMMYPGEPLPAGLVEPPEMTLPSTDGSQLASVDLAAIGAILQPETTYHFRTIAGNSNAIAYGSDLTFTTPASSSPPPGEEEPFSPNEEEPPAKEEEGEPEEEELPPDEGESAPNPGSHEQETPRDLTLLIGFEFSPPIAALLNPSVSSKPALRKKKHRKGHHQRRARKVVRRGSPIG